MKSKLNIKDKFNKELPADPNTANTRRQVKEACYSFVTPKQTEKPEMLHVSPEMINNIGLTSEDATSKEF